MKRLRGIFALLVFVTLSNAEEINKRLLYNPESCTISKLTYLYDNCECNGDKTEVRALLTVEARMGLKAPVSLTSVMDVSGSMRGDIDMLHEANVYLVNSLVNRAPPHKYGAFKFSTRVTKLEDLAAVTPARAKKIGDDIMKTHAQDDTDLYDGIKQGFTQQQEDIEENPFVRAVFVFTDGIPNVGIVDEGGIIERVKNMVKSRPDIGVYTFGLRDSVNEHLLREIARVGRGTFSYITHEDEMAMGFGGAMGGLLSQVGYDIHYTIEAEEGVTITEVNSTHNIVTDIGSGKKQIDFGDMQKGETRTAVITVSLDNGCLTDKPLMVEGGCTASGTGFTHTDSTIIPFLKADKEDLQHGCRPNDDVLAEILRHQSFSSFLIEVIDLNEKGKNAEAAGRLDDLLQAVEEIGMAEEAEWITKAKKDIKNMQRLLRTPSNAYQDAEIARTLTELYDAIVRMRTGSTNENLQSVQHLLTDSKKELIAEAKMHLAHITPSSPFTLSVSEAVSQTTTDGGFHHVDVMYTLKAPSAEENRPLLSFTVVVDTSESMSGDAAKILVGTLKRLVDWIDSKDDVNVRLGVIILEDRVVELLPLSKFTTIDDMSTVKALFDTIQFNGTGKIEEALIEGVKQQQLIASCTGTHAVFLLSNSISSSTDSIVETLQTQLGEPALVSVYTFALEEADAVQMGEIAAAGNGQKYILKSPNDIPYSFGDAIGGLLGLSAKHIKVAFTPADSDVKIDSVFPRGKDQGQGSFTASAQNVFEQEKIEFLVSVSFPESSSPDSMLSISASYDNPSTCGFANSTVDLIHSDEKSPQGIPKRRLERDVALKLKGAADICMTTPDLENVKSINDEAYAIAREAVISSSDFKVNLLFDISGITSKLESAKNGTINRGSACAQLEALIDLLESERSKGISDDSIFLLVDLYDTDVRNKSRKEMAEGVIISPTTCQERTSAASELQVQIRRAWNGHTDATGPCLSYTQSAEYNDGTSIRDEISNIFQTNALEEHDAVAEAAMESLSRIDDAIGRYDFSTALSEASTALQHVQEFPCNDDHDADTFAWHLIERSKKLVESVQARCSEGHGSVAEQLDFMVDEAVKDKEVKPWMETEGSARGAISFAY